MCVVFVVVCFCGCFMLRFAMCFVCDVSVRNVLFYRVLVIMVLLCVCSFCLCLALKKCKLPLWREGKGRRVDVFCIFCVVVLVCFYMFCVVCVCCVVLCSSLFVFVLLFVLFLSCSICIVYTILS